MTEFNNLLPKSGETHPQSVHCSPQARKRLKARYRVERRFKMIGIGAILLAIGFLAILLSTIFMQSLPAFTYTYAQLPVLLDQEMIDPDKSGSAETIRRADFDGFIKEAARQQFPWVKGRKQKRVLSRFISTGAGSILGREVVDDPSMIGGSRDVFIPVDDRIDLLAKGLNGEIERLESQGEAQIESDGDTVTVALNKDLMGKARQYLSVALENEARLLTIGLKQFEGSLVELDRRLSQGSSENTDRASLEASRESLQDQIETRRAQIASLQERARQTQSDEVLSSQSPSYLIWIQNGVVKANTLSSDGFTGEVIKPLDRDHSTDAWHIDVVLMPEAARNVSDLDIVILESLRVGGQISTRANSIFLWGGASREAELAGIWGAVVGSFLTLIVTLSVAFPIGVATAIYLEEFAPDNKFTRLIEVNINNLAAVPSIIFGLLGLAVFLNFAELPRSAPLVGGLVLALMTFPTIIIASRSALKAVPPSIRQAAAGIGASPLQVVFHHVLPASIPGILTGTIIGMAQALGETAPLLLIGMVAFIVDIPSGFVDPATVLPVQIYMWASFEEALFRHKTAAAILMLLIFLVTMNSIAILMRNRFEKRW